MLRPVSGLDGSVPEGYTVRATTTPGNGLWKAFTSEKESGLTEAEQKEVQRLREMDRRVRQHEQAHMAAGGAYVRGGAQYTFVRGPDGKIYATGGEVSIDVSPARTPEATIAKMQQVRRAALAPADPSSQDRSVAAAAARAEMDARRKLAEQALEEQRKRGERGNRDPGHTNGTGMLSPSEAATRPSAVAGRLIPLNS